MTSPRKRFLDYVRRVPGAEPVVSPFLPKPLLLEKTLRYLKLPTGQNEVENEIRLAQALNYEPMFMIDMAGLIFPPDANLSGGPVESDAGLKRLISLCERVRRKLKSIPITGSGANEWGMKA